MMGFEKFIPLNQKFYQKAPTIKIWANRQIAFNQAARRKYGIPDHRYLILFYDREKNLIGFKLTNNQKEEGAILITNNRTQSIVSGKSFFRHFALEPPEVPLDLYLDPESGLLTARVKK